MSSGARPIEWSASTGHTWVVSHQHLIGANLRKPTRVDFLWTVAMAFSQFPPRNLRVFHKAVAGGIGNDVYGNQIFCFSQPNTNFPSGMWLSLPRIICFLVFTPCTSTVPVGLVTTAYVDPTIQLPLRRGFTFQRSSRLYAKQGWQKTMKGRKDITPLELSDPSLSPSLPSMSRPFNECVVQSLEENINLVVPPQNLVSDILCCFTTC